MSSNNFNERLNDLHETLRILHKKSIQNNGLNGIDLEVIKFKIVHFYDQFLIKEDLSGIITDSKVDEIAAAPVISNDEAVQEDAISIHAHSVLTPPMEAPENLETSSVIITPSNEEIMKPTTEIKEEVAAIKAESVKASEELIQPNVEENKIQLSAAEKMIQEVFANDRSTLKTYANTEELVIENPIITKPEVTQTNSPSKGLNDRFSHIKSNNSVNERFKTSTSENFSDRFHTQATSMSELLDLNKKLLFVTQLFGGNHELFQQVLKQIDSFSNANEAIMFMEHNKPKLNLTEKQEEIYSNFLEIIKKKF